MLELDSREYKLILDHRLFQDETEATREFTTELEQLGRSLGVGVNGKLKVENRRQIVFLDTADFTLQQHNLVLRQRIDEREGTCYTLKCRTEDRFIAEGRDLQAGKGFKVEMKLEEDIGAPFVSRYSLSSTVSARGKGLPSTLAEAAKIYPGLLALEVNGRQCSPKTELHIVNEVRAHESVLKGLEFDLSGGKERFEASAALIFWSRSPKGRSAIAEFSFRYKLKKGFSPKIAQAAKDFFQVIQRTDWYRPLALSKTQFIYRSTHHDSAG